MRTITFAISILFVYQQLASAQSIVYNLYKGSKNNDTFRKRYTPFYFFVHSTYMVLLCGIYIAYDQLTPSTVLTDYPKLTTLCYGTQYLQATLRMMIASAAHDVHMPYRRSNVFSWLLMAINAASVYITGEFIFNDFWLMTTILLISGSSLAHFIYYVMLEFKTILGIEIFSIQIQLKKRAEALAKKDEGRSNSAEKIRSSKANPTPKKKTN